MRQYETMFILNSSLEAEQLSESVQKYQTLISNQGGQIDELQEIGKRRLAYEIESNREGFYVLVQYTAGTDVSKELERVMRIDENVVRYLTVRVGE